MLVKTRAYTKEDEPFVFSSWLKSARRQGDATLITNDIYFDGKTKEIKAILRLSTVTIICNPDDHEHLYSWICHQTLGDLFIIHYCYLKHAYQGLGLMNNVITHLYPEYKKEEIAITSITQHVASRRDSNKLKFIPYLKGVC